MPNQPYENFVLINEMEDQFNSYLDMDQFCTVDRSLDAVAGMTVKINRYHATNGTQKLDKGEGNTETIEASFTPYEYVVGLAQNRFAYFDEDLMEDPLVVAKGTEHMGVDMFNTTNADTYAEFSKAVLVVPSTYLDFEAFVDAESMFNKEDNEPVSFFAFINAADRAEVRKKLGEDLKYVEAYARQGGYIGTVAGINIFTKKDATRGTVIVATKNAVTKFVKEGISTGTERDENTRKNTDYFRKYYVVALTNEAEAVKVIKGSATLSEDTSVSSSKTYYEAVGNGYKAVVPAEGDNPATKGWYEITPTF